MAVDDIPNLPGEVREALAALVAGCAAELGAGLVSVVLYGGAARGRFQAGISDLNLALVLADGGAETLVRLSPLLRTVRRRVLVEPLIFVEGEIAAAAEAFSLTLLEIREAAVVLHGRDCFASIQVGRAAVRRRCEQELRNRLMRLRRAVALAGDDELELSAMLMNKRTPFTVDLKWLLRLHNVIAEIPHDPDNVLSLAVAHLGMEPGLARVFDPASGSPRQRVEVLIQALEQALARAATSPTEGDCL